jgi:hypothetical protein
MTTQFSHNAAAEDIYNKITVAAALTNTLSVKMFFLPADTV